VLCGAGLVGYGLGSCGLAIGLVLCVVGGVLLALVVSWGRVGYRVGFVATIANN